jgi:small GTP-binding protein
MTTDIIRFKCVLLGETNAGKTSLLKKYIDNTFTGDSQMTIGCAFNSKLIKIGKRSVKLDIWDTAGQEKYISMLPMYYKNARIIFICFDLSTPGDNLLKNINYWLTELNKNCNIDDREILFVGTKCDIKGAAISPIIENIMDTFPEIKYTETSSKTGKNIDKLFNSIVKKLVNKIKEPEIENIAFTVVADEEVGCFKCNIA